MELSMRLIDERHTISMPCRSHPGYISSHSAGDFEGERAEPSAFPCDFPLPCESQGHPSCRGPGRPATACSPSAGAPRAPSAPRAASALLPAQQHSTPLCCSAFC